jgi:hypothetical protein
MTANVTQTEITSSQEDKWSIGESMDLTMKHDKELEGSLS